MWFIKKVMMTKIKINLYNYIRNYRGAINQDVDKMLDSNLEVHKNGAYILLTENKNYKHTFPANNGISDVVLFVNQKIKNKLSIGEYKENINDLIYISNIEFLRLIREVKEKFGWGFSKEYREMEEEKLEQEIVKFMKEFDMIRENKETKEYIIMPMCFKIMGNYPENFVRWFGVRIDIWMYLWENFDEEKNKMQLIIIINFKSIK